jgi:hypothetical protein
MLATMFAYVRLSYGLFCALSSLKIAHFVLILLRFRLTRADTGPCKFDSPKERAI